MRIRVRLFFNLREHAPPGAGSEFGLELADGADVARALRALAIEPVPAKVILLNGRQAALDLGLREDDLLVIFPPVEGG
jgi:hypothetical protein